MKVFWQDDTAEEIPEAAWTELNKRERPRKKALRQIMAPLSDEAPTLEIRTGPVESTPAVTATPDLSLSRDDYRATSADSDDITEDSEVFEDDGRLLRVDFVPGEPWRVATASRGRRQALVEDDVFLLRVDRGLSLKKTDIFRFRIREDRVTKNGRTTTTWTVLKVVSHRRGSTNDDDQGTPSDDATPSEG